MAIEIIESYVSSKAPANAYARRGYGYTRKQAHDNAGHWNNQAPFARTRKVSVSDYSEAVPYSSDAVIAWAVVGGEAGLEFSAWGEKARALIEAGKYAQAVQLALGDR